MLPYHENISFENFTVFSNVTLEFVSGINVLIGENGTGKTHVLKALYAWQMARHLSESNGAANYKALFAETYNVTKVGELARTTTKPAIVAGKYGDSVWKIGFQADNATDTGQRPKTPRPVFIPAIEMMAHARNMNGILRDYADFDRTCFDFVAMVTAQSSSESHDVSHDLTLLKKLVPGEVEWSPDEMRFYLIERDKRLRYALVAEGVRKVTALARLIEMNWLQPGGVLFWDEPEVNLNPQWMEEIVEVLVLLARAGVQVFLATHDYVILKQLDLVLRAQRQKGKPDVPARYLSLRKERNAAKASASDNFADLEPNSILEEYDSMLSADLRLADREGLAQNPVSQLSSSRTR